MGIIPKALKIFIKLCKPNEHISPEIAIILYGLSTFRTFNRVFITIDKIMHVLESMNTYDPPIRILSFEERYKKLWEEPECVKQ